MKNCKYTFKKKIFSIIAVLVMALSLAIQSFAVTTVSVNQFEYSLGNDGEYNYYESVITDSNYRYFWFRTATLENNVPTWSSVGRAYSVAQDKYFALVWNTYSGNVSTAPGYVLDFGAYTGGNTITIDLTFTSQISNVTSFNTYLYLSNSQVSFGDIFPSSSLNTVYPVPALYTLSDSVSVSGGEFHVTFDFNIDTYNSHLFPYIILSSSSSYPLNFRLTETKITVSRKFPVSGLVLENTTQINNTVSDINDNIVDIQGDLTVIQGDLTTLSNKLTAINSAISHLENTLSNGETVEFSSNEVIPQEDIDDVLDSIDDEIDKYDTFFSQLGQMINWFPTMWNTLLDGQVDFDWDNPFFLLPFACLFLMIRSVLGR